MSTPEEVYGRWAWFVAVPVDLPTMSDADCCGYALACSLSRAAESSGDESAEYGMIMWRTKYLERLGLSYEDANVRALVEFGEN